MVPNAMESPSRTSNDAELLTQAVSGDTSAFERLVSRHLARLLAYGWALCGDYQKGQDIVQEALIIAHRKLSSFDPQADLGSWLSTIVRLQALNERRKSPRERLLTDEVIDKLYHPDSRPACSPPVDALSKCVQALPGRMGQIVQAHYYAATPLADLAGTLDLTLSAVKQLLYRARLTLRDCVRKRLTVETPT